MKKSLLYSLLLFTMQSASIAHAQMIDTANIFISNRFVQACISYNGAYGSTDSLPTGYYGDALNFITNPITCTSPGGYGLGFISKPAGDGWTVDSPNYYGDFFLPGSPWEGWAIELGGVQNNAWFTDLACGSYFSSTGLVSISGQNESYTNTGAAMIATWQGKVVEGTDSIGIYMETTLDSGAAYILMTVTLTNLGTTPLNDIYFMRSLDPDNTETYDYHFETINTIVDQMPDTANAVLVAATGTVLTAAYLGLGTADTNAKSFIAESWPDFSGYTADQYYGEVAAGAGNFYSQGFTDTSDYAIGLVFHVAHLASVDSAADSVYRTITPVLHPANTATFSYFYSFSPAATDSAIWGSTHTTRTTAINNVTKDAAPQVYPNPAKDLLNITNLNAGDVVQLYDITGRSVKTWNVVYAGNSTYNLMGLASGTYVLTVQDMSGHVTTRQIMEKL